MERKPRVSFEEKSVVLDYMEGGKSQRHLTKEYNFHKATI